jgi:chlorite dismutase
MSRAVLVVSFEEDDPERMAHLLDNIRMDLAEYVNLSDVKVYGGLREKAQQIIDILEGP